MRSEKRKSSRKPFERRAWIDFGDGKPAYGCVLGNLSETGAKVVVPGNKELPDEFVLRLSPDGRVARKCRVAWRRVARPESHSPPGWCQQGEPIEEAARRAWRPA
jgi:hypothetical protein